MRIRRAYFEHRLQISTDVPASPILLLMILRVTGGYLEKTHSNPAPQDGLDAKGFNRTQGALGVFLHACLTLPC
jgi:hypothetical protein